MSIRSKLLSAAQSVAFWGEKEWRIGPVGVLLCDLSLSVNLMRPLSAEEMAARDVEDVLPNARATYGVCVEPFMVSLMGGDGDICWASPGWNLMNWLSLTSFESRQDDEWINVGDLIVRECAMQGRHGVDYIFGDCGYPCLGYGLRFRERSKRFCGREEFVPDKDEGLPELAQLGDYCHEVEIHKDDAAMFVSRIRECREGL